MLCIELMSQPICLQNKEKRHSRSVIDPPHELHFSMHLGMLGEKEGRYVYNIFKVMVEYGW